ncbi:MAG: LysR family transcriptional regulator [Oscillospiraceae bacterium]|nr:LysR family transcriptional regulator [Oscillospiraceae bacterium]MBR3949581.1 LysR family transcriptional regulator [Oscillospiraceae bacterium]
MLKINLKQLEAFVATAEFSSFTKAAEILFLTQSTVSSHISALENTLGVRLIQRSARQRVTLTAEGERVYRDAREILDHCQALQDLGAHSTQTQLVIGASTVPGQCLLPEIMADFLKDHPGKRYVQLRGDSAQIHQYLLQGKANLGFVGVASNPKEYHYHPIAQDRLVLITASKEPYRSLHREGVSGLRLLDQPIIQREESSGTWQETERFLNRSGIDSSRLNIVARIDNPEAIKSSVCRGLGVSIISVLAAREDILSNRLLAFELGEQGAFREIYLCWRKDALLTDAEACFRDFVCKRKMISIPI